VIKLIPLLLFNFSLGKPIQKYSFFNGKLRDRIMYYDDDGSLFISEIQYESKPDSLYSITEWIYDYSNNLFSKSV
jgi:hypothetical protein